ncbi:MAG TPA: DUF559 domain-containing protein [Longimicrobium sp.]|nr:DUF559 domain-containing protein [Longimicrobium sp.]
MIEKRPRITPKMLDAARKLRRDTTPAEDELWTVLRGHQLGGFHFRRQHPIGGFILDFYCARKRVCVELDGPGHDAQQEYDQARTEALATVGIRVIRFRNEEVFHDLGGMLTRIRAELDPNNR